MTDITPKITDAKSLQDLAKIFALPMVAVAYIFQTGATISWDGNVWFGMNPELPEEIQFNRLIFIFVLKAIWSGAIAAFAYALLGFIHIATDDRLLPVIAAILFALALFGLFGVSRFPQLKPIDSFWFYASMVWGFFLLAMTEQLKPKPAVKRDAPQAARSLR